MTEPTRPLPNFEESDTAPFWEGTMDRQLRFQRCNDCDTVIFHPRRHCVGCLGHDLIWHDASGQGTVQLQHRPPKLPPLLSATCALCRCLG